jgi:hypothetical protein
LDRSGRLIEIIIPGFIAILVSIIAHDPGFLGQYTDYMTIYFRDPGRVLNGLPYVDYEFEYTPPIALIWLLASRAALLASQIGIDPFLAISRTVFSINVLFYILYIYAIYRISRISSYPYPPLALAILSPSIAYYLYYNWDIIASSLMVSGIYMLTRRRIHISAVLIGLGASIKIFPGVALIATSLAMKCVEIRKRISFLLLGVMIAGSPYVLLWLLYSPGVEYIIRYHSNWYCENCFYVLFTDDIFDSALRTVSSIAMIAIPLIYVVSYLSRHGDLNRGAQAILGASLSPVALSISLSYVYSPQMNIMISPLYIVLRGRAIALLLAQDILNTLIMILWFHENTIASAIGIESRGPWHRESPIQWIAFLRILLLWIVSLFILRDSRP